MTDLQNEDWKKLALALEVEEDSGNILELAKRLNEALGQRENAQPRATRSSSARLAFNKAS